MRAWLSVVRPMSSLLTILLVSLLWCVKVNILEIPCKEDLDWTHNYFIYFYITDKLCFYILISFWYSHFLFLPTNPLACDWGYHYSFFLLVTANFSFASFTSSFYFKVIEWNWRKLWNLQPRDVGNCQMSRRMEALAERSTDKIWDLEWPQEPWILYE